MNAAPPTPVAAALPGPETARGAAASLVLLRLATQRYALRLEAVERVIRAVAVTPVPESPAVVLGLINVAGALLPVFSLRRCLGLPDRAVRPEDQFVIARTARLRVAVVVDEVLGLNALALAQAVPVASALPGQADRLDGLVKINGEIILIYDLERLLSAANPERLRHLQAPSEPTP